MYFKIKIITYLMRFLFLDAVSWGYLSETENQWEEKVGWVTFEGPGLIYSWARVAASYVITQWMTIKPDIIIKQPWLLSNSYWKFNLHQISTSFNNLLYHKHCEIYDDLWPCVWKKAFICGRSWKPVNPDSIFFQKNICFITFSHL